MVETYCRYCTLEIKAKFLPENLREGDHQSLLSLDASIAFARSLKGKGTWNALTFRNLASYI